MSAPAAFCAAQPGAVVVNLVSEAVRFVDGLAGVVVAADTGALVANVPPCGVVLGSTYCMDTDDVSVTHRVGMLGVDETDATTSPDSAPREPVTAGVIVAATIGSLEGPGGTTLTGAPFVGSLAGSR